MRFQALTLICILTLSCCSIRRESKVVIDDDFVEPVSSEERSAIRENIAEMKSKLYLYPDSAYLYNRLAVYYRAAGTPESRLKSIEAIDRSISLEPKNPMNHVEKGLTLRARQFYGEAAASFRRAVEIDSKCFEGWYQLGRLEQYEYQKMMCFPDHLRSAIKYYTKAYRLNRRDPDVCYQLAFLHTFRQMYGTARKYANKATRYDPESPKVHLLLGAIHYHFNDFGEANDSFARAFELMSRNERYYYENISTLLDDEDRELYLTSSDVKQQEWNRKFWIENDPSPSTEINERRIEHYRRVYYAEELFRNERLAFEGPETHLGLSIISYGFPHSKQYDLGGGQSGPWLVWHYEVPGACFNLYFQDEFLNGNFHIPIFEKSLSNITISNMSAIKQVYEYPVKYVMIPLRIESAQTRGADERTRTEFSIAMPDTVLVNTQKELDIFLTFFDSDWYRITQNHFEFKVDTLLRISRLRDDFSVYNFWLDLTPRLLEYNCVIEVVDEKNRHKGVWRQPLEVRDLFGRSLKLSDIKLKIIDEGGSCTDVLDPIPTYGMGGRLCMSYEIYNLKRGSDNLAHYRLTYMIKEPPEEERSGIGRTLSYVWKSIRGGRDEEAPYITSTIEQSTSSGMAADKLQIELSMLERGRYILLIEVEDLERNETVTGERFFMITD